VGPEARHEPPPAAAVVVATHDRAGRLAALLAGLRRQTLPPGYFEVIVVDDASADATQDVLAAELARGELRLTMTANREALGPAAARNRGWRLASAPLIAFTDDDCVPTPAWLEELIAAAVGHPDAIVRGPTLPDPAETDRLGPFSKTVAIDGPSPHFETCNVAYPRALLERIGGFDESYPTPAGEDSDLGSRALAAGGVPAFTARALVHHAVFSRGPREALGDALLAADGVRAYKRNPELRRNLALGMFYDRSHPLLLAAFAGLLTRRPPVAAALCLPYARNLRARVRDRGLRPRHAGYLALFDAVQLYAAARGSARHRTFIL
jgi:GT2 family glycosyltransferase